MTLTEILTRISALASEDEDEVGYVSALAIDVMARGIVNDEDPSATEEACREALRIATEVRALAAAARAAMQTGVAA